MKKTISILNDYFSNFWFVILLLTIACFAVLVFAPLPAIISLGQNGFLTSLSLTIWYFFIFFFLPSFLISALISILVWLRGEQADRRRGLISLIVTIISISCIFLLTIKLSSTQSRIMSGDIFIPTIGTPGEIMTK